MTRIAIVPARAGSKRIPGKNIRSFHGKPLIAYSIQSAIDAQCFDRIVVSTDDERIADIARACGAEVPFMRPAHLADDFATTTAVVQHALQALNAVPGEDYACCIYATAPFLRASDLQAAYAALVSSDADYCFSVTSYAFPIQRAVRMLDGGRVEMFRPEFLTTRSQDLEAAYHDAGQFYWGRVQAFLTEQPVFSSASMAYILPRVRVQDIDTLEDWQAAEAMFTALQATR